MNQKKMGFRRKENVVCRHIAGEYLLVPVSGELADLQVIFTLNPVGHCIWETLAEESTVEALRQQVTARFDVDEEQARRDVDEFLESLSREELVTAVTA